MDPRSSMEPQGASPLGCALLAVAFLLLAAGGGVAWMFVRRPPPGLPATAGAPPMPPMPISAPSHGPPVVPQPVAPSTVSPPVASPTPVVPGPVPADAEVRGALGRDVIRRVVRRHVSEVRACYEQGLAVDPTLAGAVSVSFFIGGSGTVDSAQVSASSLAGPQATAVSDCVVARVRTWVFPAPDGGGVVAVNYPFVFSSP